MDRNEFEEKKNEIMDALFEMNMAEREELFVNIDMSYCFKCGGEHGSMRRCPCLKV